MEETGGLFGGIGSEREPYEEILDCVEEGIYVLDPTGRVAFANPASARMVGWEAEELIGRPQHETVHHSRADGSPYPLEECPIRATLRDGAVRRVSGEIFWRKDGTSFPVEYTASAVRREGEVIGAVVAFRDVSERLRAEETLRESEERYRLLVENAVDYAMFTLDTDGRVLSWNTGAERVFGYRENEALGQPSSFVFVPEDVEAGAPKEELETAVRDGRAVDERWHLRKDGSRFFASGLVELMRDDSGNLIGFAKIARDVTARKLADEEAGRLNRERSEIARILQNALLPPRLPEVPGVELAARYVAAGEGVEVGGDFYDVFRTADGGDASSSSWAVVLGDVSGKGPEAAALTSLARHTLRATAVLAGSPSRALAALNEEILRQAEGERFFSVVLAELRPDPEPDQGARLTLVRAGHPAPLLLRAAGGGEAVEELGEPGTVLGIRPDPKLPEGTARLGPGDAAVFYTDGVTEARTPEGAFFGEEGLRATLEGCARLSADEIEGEVLAFQRGAVRDDAAILVLRIPDCRGDGP